MTDRPLRVCFVIQKLLGLSGGAERILLQTATAMAARGMTVEVMIYDTARGTPQFDTTGVTVTNLLPPVLRRPSGARPDNSQTPKIVKGLPHSGVLGHLKWAATHGLFARRLKTALRKGRFDVVVGFLPPGITAAVRAGTALGVPVIASAHNVPQEDFGLDSPRWDQNPVYRRRARAALSDAAAITVLQDGFRDWFTPSEQARITVMPNPIGRLSPAPAIPVPRARRVLAVGRLAQVKRFDLLIAAWAAIRDDFPDWRVDIYGEGPQNDTLSVQIATAGLQDIVRLCGVTPDLGPQYDSASLLCHPASFEGFGLAVAESMAHGTPAMGFADCAGINRLVTSGVDGILLDPGQDRVMALAAGLRQALSQPAHLHALGQAATAITQAYSPDEIAAQWDSLIRSCAAR